MKLMCEIYQHQLDHGKLFLHEQPLGNDSWPLPCVMRLSRDPRVLKARCRACSVLPRRLPHHAIINVRGHHVRRTFPHTRKINVRGHHVRRAVHHIRDNVRGHRVQKGGKPLLSFASDRQNSIAQKGSKPLLSFASDRQGNRILVTRVPEYAQVRLQSGYSGPPAVSEQTAADWMSMVMVFRVCGPPRKSRPVSLQIVVLYTSCSMSSVTGPTHTFRY